MKEAIMRETEMKCVKIKIKVRKQYLLFNFNLPCPLLSYINLLGPEFYI